MLRMDRVHVIRHKLEVEGKSLREVARELGHSRNTIAKYATTPMPDRKAYAPRGKPVLDAVRPRIDALLADWKRDTTRKQRITATAVHKALVAQGCTVGVTTVRDYMRELKLRDREVYVPLEWLPGDAAQVDFFEVTVRIGGEPTKAWLFLMRMVYSGHDFVWIYPRCDQICFLDAHVRAFAHFGAVPQRIIYDNLKPAVLKVVAPRRVLAPRFIALSKHYLFEPCFARPGEGHDKGSVEARGKGIRLAHMVPMPCGETLEDVAATLAEDVAKQGHESRNRERDNEIPAVRFERELPRMISLPSQPFEARHRVQTTVTSTSGVRIEGAWYSVPVRWARRDVVAYIGVHSVTIRHGDESISAPRQAFGGRHVRQRHYLPELARKPQAVRQNIHLIVTELGDPFPVLWRLLVDRHGPRDGARWMARVLGAVVNDGEESVRKRILRAIEEDALDTLLLDRPKAKPEAQVPVPEGLDSIVVEAASITDYDALLGGDHV